MLSVKGVSECRVLITPIPAIETWMPCLKKPTSFMQMVLKLPDACHGPSVLLQDPDAGQRAVHGVLAADHLDSSALCAGVDGLVPSLQGQARRPL